MNVSRQLCAAALLLPPVLGLADLLEEPSGTGNAPPWRGKAVDTVLDGGIGSIDTRYEKDVVPWVSADATVWKATAWRGERVSGQFVIWTGQGLKNVQLSTTDLQSEKGIKIASDHLESAWVRFSSVNKEYLFADILEPSKPIDIAPTTTRPVWLTLNVPRDAVPACTRAN